jgi:hypothetical protein
MYLASELVARGHIVSMISPVMSNDVEEGLRANGITPINLRTRLVAKNSGLSLLWFETWAREAFLQLNSRHIVNDPSATINFSQVIAVPSSVWYLQGPPSTALEDMRKELSTGLKTAYYMLKPLIKYVDKKLIDRMNMISMHVVANSKFCASMYSDFGVKVQDVIYPPIDCHIFRPSTSNPRSDYVLTYFGKETKFSVIKSVADAGAEIKAFGSKTPFIPRDLLTHHNIQFLGRVTTSELVDLFSNALFTLFPFTHEPFGYVPLESMACGTPVLTFDVQGPSEYVIDGRTGWLAHDDDWFAQKSVELWKEGYDPLIRPQSVEAASRFDKKVYTKKWLRLLSHFDNCCLPDCCLTAEPR